MVKDTQSDDISTDERDEAAAERLFGRVLEEASDTEEHGGGEQTPRESYH